MVIRDILGVGLVFYIAASIGYLIWIIGEWSSGNLYKNKHIITSVIFLPMLITIMIIYASIIGYFKLLEMFEETKFYKWWNKNVK